MRLILYFILSVIVLSFSALIVFLNQEPVELILTPPVGGTYYIIPDMPLGLLVLVFFFSGLAIGYLLSFILK